jgi:Right handed beta helix region
MIKLSGPKALSSYTLRSIFRSVLILSAFILISFGAGLTTSAATLVVPAGGNLQDTLNAANPGDTIILEAGASFTGPFTLPFKPGSNTDADFITIQSSALSLLPSSSQRVSPSHSPLMPKLLSPGNDLPALLTAPFAHHYRLIGIEIAPRNASALVRDLVLLGDGSSAQNSLAMIPHHLVLDRCYIHAFPTQDSIRGVALNSASTDILNCYIAEIHHKSYDSQAVWGWNGPGPFKIINNYLEASGENAGFGGSDPAVRDLIPSDIEIRHNTLSKPLTWRGVWAVKNLFEIKSAQRVTIEGNVFENCWADAQNGFAILLTVRNQSGAAPWSTIRDVAIRHNIIRHAGSGFNLLGQDSSGVSYESVRMRNVRIENNLLTDIDGGKWGGSGIFLQITNTEGVVVDHNTVVHSGSAVMAYVTVNNLGPSVGFEMTNNIMQHNEYGIFGQGQGMGKSAVNWFFPRAVIRRNVIVGADASRYPPDNFYPHGLGELKFVDWKGGDYRLSPSSRYKRRGTDGKDVGCDMDALEAALAPSTALPGRLK